MEVIRNNNIIISEGQKAVSRTGTAPTQQNQVNFKDVLNKRIESNQPLQFSKHANMRLGIRDIKLSTDQLKRVESGVNKASEKGIKDSLVLVDDVALVVNVKNKMVITAMSNGKDNVFTNIDGAVIV